MDFSSMQTMLSSMLEDDNNNTWSETLIKQFLNWANQEAHLLLYEKTEWQLSSTNVSAESDTQAYDLPADFLYAGRVYIADTTVLNYQEHRDPGNKSTNTGSPAKYYIEGSYSFDAAGPTTTYARIGFTPIPDDDYTVTVEYYPIPAEMSGNTDVSNIPSPFHDLIIYRAMAIAFDMKGLAEMRALYQQRYEEKLKMLIKTLGARHRYPRPRFNKDE